MLCKTEKQWRGAARDASRATVGEDWIARRRRLCPYCLRHRHCPTHGLPCLRRGGWRRAGAVRPPPGVGSWSLSAAIPDDGNGMMHVVWLCCLVASAFLVIQSCAFPYTLCSNDATASHHSSLAGLDSPSLCCYAAHIKVFQLVQLSTLFRSQNEGLFSGIPGECFPWPRINLNSCARLFRPRGTRSGCEICMRVP